MILLSGLGNPGIQFQDTRHNIGFDIIDSIQENYNESRDKLTFEKRARIKAGSKERMKRKGEKGRPTDAQFKRAAKTAKKKPTKKKAFTLILKRKKVN